MARVRSGQAPAWPLVSGQRGCRGSDAQGWVLKIISAERLEMIWVPLTVEGHPPTLSGPSPDLTSSVSAPGRWSPLAPDSASSRTRWSPSDRGTGVPVQVYLAG